MHYRSDSPYESHPTTDMFSRLRTNLRAIGLSLVLASAFVNACNSGSGSSGNGDDGSAGDGSFEIRLGAVGALVEGAESPLFIPVELDRIDGFDGAVDVRLEGQTGADTNNLIARYTNTPITAGGESGGVLLNLAIGDLPLLPHTRSLVVIASTGETEARIPIDITVEPVDAPDVYLLVGQSNMTGSPLPGTRDAGPGGADESNPRVLQLNVSGNDPFGLFADAASFTDIADNVAFPAIVVAEDPLHIPRGPEGPDGAAKPEDFIGLGLSFGKLAAMDTTRDVVLVPAAWGGSAFCDNPGGPLGQWNADAGTADGLGNTLLFDRALTRVNAALAETGGILRGILWHQGESDANEVCAPLYQENLTRLIGAMRSRIASDARGPELRRADANIPFVVGTLSRGDDVADFSAAKEQVDQTLRNMPNVVNNVGLSIHDDLVPPAFPCGTDGCIHFGAEALREMGRRYYQALRSAAFVASPSDVSIAEGR